MIYDYVLIDSKLLSYMCFHRKRPANGIFYQLALMLKINHIRFKRLVFAVDMNRSHYRLQLQADYKGHRDILQHKQATDEQRRRDQFVAHYKTLHELFNMIGITLQPPTAETEADDMRLLLREMVPQASNVLLISLDEDWYSDVTEGIMGEDGVVRGATHLLKYTKNTLITSQEQVEDLYMLSGNLLVQSSAITGQKKDNILGLTNFGRKRFIKHLAHLPEEEWVPTLEQLVAEGKYNMHLDPKAKYTTVLEQYQHNLLMMMPQPLDKYKADDLKYAKERLAAGPVDVAYEYFMRRNVELTGALPRLTPQEFNLFREGNT